MADSVNDPAATSASAAAISITKNLDRVVVDGLLLNTRLFDDPPIHHTDAQLADSVAHILTDLGPTCTADGLAEYLQRIHDVCSEAVSQNTIDVAAKLLPPLSQDVTLEQKIELFKVILKASSRAMDVLAHEKAQYLRNLRIFHQVLQRQLSELQAIHASMGTVGAFIGNGVLETSNKLWLLVRESPEERVHDRYLVDIQRYWRRFAGKEAARGLEDGWVYLADCELTWEY